MNLQVHFKFAFGVLFPLAEEFFPKNISEVKGNLNQLGTGHY